MQVVYEFLVRFVVSSEVDAKQAKQYVDQALCLQLVDLFDRCVIHSPPVCVFLCMLVCYLHWHRPC